MRYHRTTAHTCSGLSDLGLAMHRSRAKGESVQQQQRWGAMEPRIRGAVQVSSAHRGSGSSSGKQGAAVPAAGPYGTGSWGNLALMGSPPSLPAQCPVSPVTVRATECPGDNFLFCFNERGFVWLVLELPRM